MSFSPALTQLFNQVIAETASLYAWRLYTMTLFGGLTVRFTDADFDIKGVSTSALVNGFLYPSSGIRVDHKESKTQAHLKVGLDVDNYVLVVIPRSVDPVTLAAFPDTIGGQPWQAAAHAGMLDGADFQVDEAYFSSLPTWPMPAVGVGTSPVGCRTIFAGQVAECDMSEITCTLTVEDYRNLLTMQMPRNLFQSGCRWTLFDAGCNASGNMNIANFQVIGSVGAGSTKSTIIAPGLGSPRGVSSGTYLLGKLMFTSGANGTFSVWAQVRAWDGGNTLSLLRPLPFTPQPGDTFTITPGCDKSFTACTNFGNAPNFGGFPNIPAPEVLA